jgi:SAM-dependent methyltransferase
LAEIVCQLELQEQRVVDLGCGIGITCLVSSMRSARVVGLDYTPECLEIAQKNNLDRENVEFILFNWFHPIPEYLAGFDLLIGGDVLYMRNAVKPIIHCVQRLIKENGVAVFVDPGRPSVWDFVDECAGVLECVVYQKLNHKSNIGSQVHVIPKAIVVIVMKEKSTSNYQAIATFLESNEFQLL